MTRVLVTGGAGFIGSNLVETLLERGDDVRVLDNFSTGSRANLATLGREIEVVEGDLRSYERVHTAVRGVELVFHQGALGSVPRSVQDPLTSTAVNVEGPLVEDDLGPADRSMDPFVRTEVALDDLDVTSE